MISSATVQSAIVLMNRRMKVERGVITFVPVCSNVEDMHLHHLGGTKQAQAQTHDLSEQRANSPANFSRARKSVSDLLWCRRWTRRSSRCRRICGTARHERSRQLKLSYALSFSLKFFQLTLTLLLYFALLFSFFGFHLRAFGSGGGKLLDYRVSCSLHLCGAGSLAPNVGRLRHSGFFFLGQRYLPLIER